MMKMKFCTVAGAAFLLSACGWFNGSASDVALASEADLSSYFAQRLAAGRAHLDNGRPTMAIAAFRQASYDPAYAGEAYNGMAIAYSRIGRNDVARNLFAEAVRRDPQDERFARNLARLDERIEELRAGARSNSDAGLAQGPATDAAAAPAAMPLTNQHVTVQSAADTGLVRVSRHEVRLGAATARASANPMAPGRAVVRVSVNQASGYPVRVQLSSSAQRRQAPYPIRVALGSK